MKRVLILTYYWPPAGGPGVQRWLKFVKYFEEFGIDPVVFIPENPTYPLLDFNLEKEIPSDLKILKLPIDEPYRFANWIAKKKTGRLSSGIISDKKPSFLERLLLYIRGNFFIPDARIGWVKPSVLFLEDYLKKDPADLVITTGPPHSLHLTGLQLKNKTGIPWLADFRDPWTTIHYHQALKLSGRAAEKHRRLEKSVLQQADLITVTSPSTKEEFQQKTTRPVAVVTNGYDPEDAVSFVPDTRFSIAHIGSLLSRRNPEILWQALSELAAENREFEKSLEIKLAGAVSDTVLESLKKYNLFRLTRLFGYVSHQEAVRLQHESRVLLLVEIDSPETRAILPGKLFEYLAARRPIIALGPKDSDIKKIIEDTESGKFFTPREKDQLKTVLLGYFEAFQNDTLHLLSKNIEKYSRREVSREMSRLILSL